MKKYKVQAEVFNAFLIQFIPYIDFCLNRFPRYRWLRGRKTEEWQNEILIILYLPLQNMIYFMLFFIIVTFFPLYFKIIFKTRLHS